ncbi:MAG: hypothetical protein MZV65_47270 [Chromatiales bacterium]|nr:hypothetical protein [Chromatiales bacterium]
MHPQDTIVSLDGVKIGGPQIVIMAGPCAVESRTQILETAQAVKEAGAHVLRGGAYKPRTSPYSFQGMGEEGLQLLAEAREATGLPDRDRGDVARSDVALVAKYADMLQIGARNMQNFAPAARGRRGQSAGAAEARHDVHHRRVVDVGGVHSVARQHAASFCASAASAPSRRYTRNTTGHQRHSGHQADVATCR